MHLRLLHTPSLQLADGRLQPLAANDAALFAVLAIDGPTSRETMAELLWPDSPGEGARVNLRQRLSRWKARAGLVLLQSGGGNMLALPPPPGTATAALGAAVLSHDLQDLAERLRVDPAAGSGELLGSFEYDDNPRLARWLSRARAQWRGERLEAMAAIAERLEREHHLAEALSYAGPMVLDDPLAEHAHRRVMRLHYLRGDRSAALAAHDRLRTLLRDELGTIPSRETLELAAAAARPGDEPVRLLLTARSNEAVPALMQWQAEQAAHGACSPLELRLGPLDGDAVAALIESLALAELEARHWAAPLLRHTGGNPLFIVQTLITALNGRLGQLLGEGGDPAPASLPLPEHVAALIDQRLQRLSSAALRLARVAAIAGADFDAELAARVLQTHPVDLTDAWAELEHHGILREHCFVHDLLHEVALRSVPRPIARMLHRGVAQALQGRPVAPARLAEHWLQAGDWAPAGEAFSAAAAAAGTASRRAEELAFLDQAASALTRAGGLAAAFQARLRAVDAAVVVDPGQAVTQRIQALLADAADPVERLDALLAQCKQLLSDADFDAAREPARQAMALALGQPDPARRVAAAGWHGLALTLAGQPDSGLAVFESLADDAARLAGHQVALDFFGAHGYALHHASRFDASLESMRHALAIARQLGDTNEAMVQALNVGLVLRRTGNRGGALAAFERALDCWRRLDEPRGVSAASLHMYIGVLHADAGRYGDALTALGWSVEQFRSGRSVDWAIKAEHRLAAVYLALGQPAKALQALTPLPADASAIDRLARVMAMCRLPGPGRDAFAAQLAACVARQADDVPAMDRLSAELLLSALSPPERAAELSSAARARALALNAPAVALHALIRHADALRRGGDTHGAAALAEAAVADIGDCGEHGFHDLQPGEFWWLAFSTLDAGGRHAAARHALDIGVGSVRRIAREQVPAEFVDSYLNRNPHNCDLLAAAGRVR